MHMAYIIRQSGTHSTRPNASTAIGSRWFSTDTGAVYVSMGATWQQVKTVSPQDANGLLSGLLSARPTASANLGWLYTDENGVTYEAFPGGWATVVLEVLATQSSFAAPSVAVANAGTPNGNALVTIQAKDGLGNNLAARCLVRVFFAATAYGAPADLGTLTATTGTILKEDTDDALATVLTDATGLAVLQLDTASDGTVHAMACVAGIFATSSAAITGN
jgi:hypothetical protein